jgi:hypothetical protein
MKKLGVRTEAKQNGCGPTVWYFAQVDLVINESGVMSQGA